MRILLIEDESLSARKLQRLLEDIDPSLVVEGALESIEASVRWLATHPQPDLIFMDIQLSDGLSFEIFKQIPVRCPVIFTTAFDEYALQAFKVNGIAYLLKPINKEELSAALQKLEALKLQFSGSINNAVAEALLSTLKKDQHSYKSRFLLKSGQSWITILASEIAYFHSDQKLTFLITREGKKHSVDESLEELEEHLNPHEFFRLNRQFIASVGSIASIQQFFSGKLKLHLKPAASDEVIVSREKAGPFKKWLNQ
jgi:DNA-binding LytR/AlgR family response regulator